MESGISYRQPPLTPKWGHAVSCLQTSPQEATHGHSETEWRPAFSFVPFPGTSRHVAKNPSLVLAAARGFAFLSDARPSARHSERNGGLLFSASRSPERKSPVRGAFAVSKNAPPRSRRIPLLLTVRRWHSFKGQEAQSSPSGRGAEAFYFPTRAPQRVILSEMAPSFSVRPVPPSESPRQGELSR
jgi:hypothetical protein